MTQATYASGKIRTMGGRKMKPSTDDKPKPPDYREHFGTDFATQVRTRQRLKIQIEKLKVEKGEIDNLIGGLLETYDLKSVMVGKLAVTLCQGTNTSLSKTRLMELGVLADVIEQATKRTHYPYVQVREKTEK